MLSTLPPEIILVILSYLPLRNLLSVQILSHAFKKLFESHESAIYRNAALYHRFISSSDEDLVRAKSINPTRSMHGVDSWKSFSQRRLSVEKGWLGYGQFKTNTTVFSQRSVHRLKIDEDQGFIITTSPSGGIFVTDLDSRDELWSLSSDHAYDFAHCEYGKGFLIFDQYDDCKEVWRLATDFCHTDHNVLASSQPNDRQRLASDQAAATYRTPMTQRGHFKPWALLRMPVQTRAFRFVYPTLLVVGYDRAFLWDVTTGELTMTIEDILAIGVHGQRRYVELSERYVFIIGLKLCAFSREDGSLIFALSFRDLVGWTMNIEPHGIQKSRHLTPLAGTFKRNDISENKGFVSVHVTPSTSHVVVLLESGNVLVIRELDRIIKKEITLHDSSLEINFLSTQSPFVSSPYYLALENDKVGVATSNGVYVIVLDSQLHKIMDTDHTPQHLSSLPADSPFRGISVSLVVALKHLDVIRFISCLQMTDTRLLFATVGNWTRRLVFCVDIFSR